MYDDTIDTKVGRVELQCNGTTARLRKFHNEVQVPQCEACRLLCRQVINWLTDLTCVLGALTGSPLVHNRHGIQVQQKQGALGCTSFGAFPSCSVAQGVEELTHSS